MNASSPDPRPDRLEEQTMRDRPFDPISFVFGGLFAVLGLLGLMGPGTVADLDLALLASATLVVLGGLLLVVSPLRRSRRAARPNGPVQADQATGNASSTTSP
jgi:hypothetical protein